MNHILFFIKKIYIAGKQAWPELVGKTGKYAVAKIKEENPFVRPIIVPEESPTDQAYFCNRVFVVVNESGIVTQVPMVG